jgi:nucleoid-associated protein
MVKEQYSRDVSLKLRPALLDPSAKVVSLLDQVRKLYNSRSGRGYGQFEPDRFLTRELHDLSDDPQDFVEFTSRCMGDLASRVEEVNLATGGYVIFVRYEQSGDDFFMIVMLKSTPGLTFDDALEILDVEHLDLNRLHFAARVNLTEWDNDGDRYISFVKGRATDISSYFKAFIGVAELSEGAENTRQLINAVKDYCEEIGLGAEEAEDLKRRVHGYCEHKAKAGDPLLLEDLSSFMDGDQPTHFLEFANEREISDEIDLDRKSLRTLVKYYGRDSDVSVSFAAKAYRNRVRYDAEQDILTIHPTPAGLRTQLGNA